MFRTQPVLPPTTGPYLNNIKTESWSSLDRGCEAATVYVGRHFLSTEHLTANRFVFLVIQHPYRSQHPFGLGQTLTPIPTITARRSLPLPSHTCTLSACLTVCFPLRERYRLTTFIESASLTDLAPLYTPVAQRLRQGRSKTLYLTTYLFGSGVYTAPFACFS